MPQEFQILRCCDCEKFQVHHVKKAKKWQCKVCGLKQSLIRAFFIGSARDCRVNVQKLNFQAGEQEMKRTLGESCDSTDENPSLELVNKDSDVSNENDLVDENDWIDNNDGIGENDWVDENDWIDEDDGIDGNDWFDENDGFDENIGIDETQSKIFESLHARSSLNDFDDELPRKKQRCESYSESETVEKDYQFNEVNKEGEDQRGFFSLILKCKEGGKASKTIESANVSSIEVPKMDREQECDRKENSVTEAAKSRSNSILKPTRGFQSILNEAKKQKTNLSFDLDW